MTTPPSTRPGETLGRTRPRYAPLTAGLLARKGEATPASPLFAAEALGLPPVLSNARLPLADRAAEPAWGEIRDALQQWGARVAGENETSGPCAEETRPDRGPETGAERLKAPERQPAAHTGAHKSARATITLALGLEIMARLMLEARRSGAAPAHIVESALGVHLPREGACPLCKPSLLGG